MKDFGMMDKLKEEEEILNKLHKHTGSLEMFLNKDLFTRNLKFMQTKHCLNKTSKGKTTQEMKMLAKDRLIIVMHNIEQRTEFLPTTRAKSMSRLERKKEVKIKEEERVVQNNDSIFKEKTQKLINRFNNKIFRPMYDRLNYIKKIGETVAVGHYYHELGTKDKTNSIYKELNDQIFIRFKNEFEKSKNTMLRTNMPVQGLEKSKNTLERDYENVNKTKEEASKTFRWASEKLQNKVIAKRFKGSAFKK